MKKVLIVGAGISGLIAAYQIVQNTDAKVFIIEKGKPYTERIAGMDLELASGEGGAGTVYGGKLCFPPASSGVWKRTGIQSDELAFFNKNCLKYFIHGKKFPDNYIMSTILLKENNLFQKKYESILLSKSEMNQFIICLLNEVKKCGVKIFTSCEFYKLKKTKEGFRVKYKKDDIETIEEYIDYLLFASGRLSSGQIMKWFGKQGIVMQQNPDLGIRFSIDYDKTGVFKEIGKDIKIKAKLGDIGVRTFCVCSGGSKAIVNLDGMKYFDGHFGNEITQQINLGILARSSYIYGYEGAALYCSCLRDYLRLDWSLKDFVRNRDKLVKETNLFDDVLDAITYFIYMLQKSHILEENLDKYPMWFPSVDRLNPIIQTDQYFETNCENMYVIGDAVGISRGYIQAMWSGYTAGNRIVEKLEGKIKKEKIRA